MSFEMVPIHPLTIIVGYLGSPDHFLPLLEVSTAWRDQFDSKNGEIWWIIACDLKVSIHSPLLKRSSRSTSNHKRVFLKAYHNRQKMLCEKHDYLIMVAKDLFKLKRDCPMRLQKLIKSTFPNCDDFDVNWRSSATENNSLLTMASRSSHFKCMRLLVEYYKSDINLCDIGGFTPLIMCAYHGDMNGVMYCLKNGADISAQGRLRSGQCLTAEHWAAVENNQDIYQYLRAIRIRREKRAARLLKESQQGGNGHHSSGCTAALSSSSSTDAVALRKALLQSIAHDDPSLWNINSFCTCGRGYVGQMVACEAPHCPIEWYHFKCVGLQSEPEGDWYCANCTSQAVFSDTESHSSRSSSSTLAPAPTVVTTPDYSSAVSGYCICGLGFNGDMVACEAPGCLVEWYHFQCVGLVSEPEGVWICAACRGEKFKEPAKVLSPPHKKRRRHTETEKSVVRVSSCHSSNDSSSSILKHNVESE